MSKCHNNLYFVYPNKNVNASFFSIFVTPAPKKIVVELNFEKGLDNRLAECHNVITFKIT